MNEQLVRLPTVMATTGAGRTKTLDDVKLGLMPRPVKIGFQSVAWPMSELQAVVRARIAGKTDDEIRALVAELHAARKALA